MSAAEKRTISLPQAQAIYIDALVSSGKYASASEVIRAGLRALEERDAAVQQWLKEEVASVYDAMQADPSRGVSADDLLTNLRHYHSQRTNQA